VQYLLDTNTLSEMLKGHSRLQPRIDALEPSDAITVPVVAWYEILSGRIASLLKAANPDELLIAQSRFDQDFNALKSRTLFGITPSAAQHFEKLLKDKKCRKIRRADLLIACIALAHKAVLVTRNVKDFTNVPGLILQNWFE
jgi:tRNA(fMet)-specific endonuclease VapC